MRAIGVRYSDDVEVASSRNERQRIAAGRRSYDGQEGVALFGFAAGSRSYDGQDGVALSEFAAGSRSYGAADQRRRRRRRSDSCGNSAGRKSIRRVSISARCTITFIASPRRNIRPVRSPTIC